MTSPGRYPEKLTALLETLDTITDPGERALVLIGYADRFREVPADVTERPFPPEHRVPACESEAYVWLIPRQDGTLDLHFAVENPSGVSAKALAMILKQSLSGLSPEEISRVSDDIVERIFRQNISMGKGIGLMEMVRMVKALAEQQQKRMATKAS